MKKVMKNHQEELRKKRSFHLHKDTTTMAKSKALENNCKAFKSDLKGIIKTEIFTPIPSKWTTEVLWTYQMIIFKLFKKNNRSHLQVGLELALCIRANSWLYRKMKIRIDRNQMQSNQEAGLTLPSTSKFFFWIFKPIFYRNGKDARRGGTAPEGASRRNQN